MNANKIRLFWLKVDQSGDGCWNWVAAINHAGYGLFSFEKKSRLAHRISWMIYHGEIPDGLHVLHKCDNPSCVRPSHLWLGRPEDNMKDTRIKGRSASQKYRGNHLPSGEKHHFYKSGHKITREQAMEIRKSPLTRKEISSHYGVDVSLISMIKSGKIWK